VEGLKRRAVVLEMMERMNGYGSWSGETHVQKCLYFLQELVGVPTGFRYILYKHGPFSFDLRDELTAMRADGLVEVYLKSPNYGPSLRPGPRAKDVMDLFPKTVKKYREQTDFVARWLSPKNVSELERLATALYVTREQPSGSSPEKRAKLLNQLKPHVSVEDALSAVRDVDQICEELMTENHRGASS